MSASSGRGEFADICSIYNYNDNVSSETPSTIFFLEEDDHARQILTRHLRRLDYRVLVAAHLDDAMEWMNREFIHADLVLVDLVRKTTEEALHVGRELRQRAKYDGHTPLIIMAEKYGPELEGTDVRVGEHDWITYPEDGEQMPRLLKRLLPAEQSA
jgi:DNA-binding NtrC family response regulator